MDEQVGAGEKRLETSAVGRIAQIHPRLALAGLHFWYKPRLLTVARIDAQHVSTETRQEACPHRPGNDAREIEDADTVQRAGGDNCRIAGRAGGDIDPCQRFGYRRRALRERRPLSDIPHFRGAPPGFDDSLLQRSFAPAGNRSLDCFLFATVHGEDVPGGHPMARYVGVEADPAVTRFIIPAHRIPGIRHFPADRTELRREPETGQPAIYGNRGRRVTLHCRQFSDGESRRRYRSIGKVGGGKGRGDLTTVMENDIRQPCR